jgi:mannosyltransferase OCH1-like enzyme
MAYVSQSLTIEDLDLEIARLQSDPSFPIPKIIHQVWVNSNPEVPDIWKASPREWQKLHPGWMYILWSEDLCRNFVKKYEPEFLGRYDTYPYAIQRIDAIRYCFLKHYGGLYVDLDLVPLENVESHLMDSCDTYFVNSANISSSYTNSVMASKPKSLIWDEVLNAAKKSDHWWAWGKHFTVMTTTGPMMLTNVIKDHSRTICRLPWVRFNPDGVDDIGSISSGKSGTILKNLEGGSWHDLDTLFYNFIFKNRQVLILIMFIILLVIIYYMYMYWKRCQQCQSVCVAPVTMSRLDTISR